jgi:hypothetical protein
MQTGMTRAPQCMYSGCKLKTRRLWASHSRGEKAKQVGQQLKSPSSVQCCEAASMLVQKHKQPTTATASFNSISPARSFPNHTQILCRPPCLLPAGGIWREHKACWAAALRTHVQSCTAAGMLVQKHRQPTTAADHSTASYLRAVPRSYTDTVPSSVPVASWRPSGENARHVGQPLCALIRRTHAPVPTSHSRTVRSLLPVAMYWLLGCHATVSTSDWWPGGSRDSVL